MKKSQAPALFDTPTTKNSDRGVGIVPDMMSLDAKTVAKGECSSATMEQNYDPRGGINPPYGKDGMMPAPVLSYGKMQPGLRNSNDEGVGGAGSFLTNNAIGAKG